MYNNDLDPVFNDVANNIKDIKKDILEIQSSRQLYNGDWYEFGEKVFVFQLSPPFFKFSNPAIIPSQFIQPGDKIRIIQSGITKYAYAIGIGSLPNGSFTLVFEPGGIALNTDPITSFAKGIVPNPQGHPGVFFPSYNFITPTTGSFTGSTNNMSYFYVGTTLFLSVQVSGGTLTGGPANFDISLPQTRITTFFDADIFQIISSTYSGSRQRGLLEMSGTNVCRIYGNEITLAGFPNSTGNVGFSFQVSYRSAFTS